MDTFEKKYNEALERAKAYHRNELAGSRKEMMEYIFPELRESEDERIRKAIVHLLDVASEAYLVGETGFKKEQFLSYLEKQKELTPADGWDYADKRMSHPLYLEGFEAGRAVERELSEFEKRKEQKPAEWSEEDEKMIERINSILDFHPSYEKEKNWFNSLRPQTPCPHYTGTNCIYVGWKPSEEQINSAIYAVGFLGHDSEKRKHLESLIFELQKLNEK